MLKSSVFDLPAKVREELNERLIQGGFKDYDAHAEWLKGLGYPMSRSAVHRYGQEFYKEWRVQAIPIEQAKAAARAAAMAVRRWEYRVLDLYGSPSLEDLEKGLNEQGEDRWELVAVSHAGGWVFKRPRLDG